MMDLAQAMRAFDVVIGLEVHAQLASKTKLFCGCATTFGASPNQQTCPVCLGLPGSLPTVNAEAIKLAVRASMALGCSVHERSIWARKNYFYPDLPKGYQITQDTSPLATRGVVRFALEEQQLSVRVTRVHVEEDAGKNVHDDVLAGDRSWVDLNRGGTPLIEIVSEPDITSSAAAAEYLRTLRQMLRYLDVCDGNMEEGSLRCDANVSLKRPGDTKLGTRVELKNINSFRFVQQAIDYEIVRQAGVLEEGGTISQQTRLWDTQAKESRSMRSKENATDYRYFPEPDLPALVLPIAYLQEVRAGIPELGEAKRARLQEELGLSAYDARILTEDRDIAAMFDEALKVVARPKAIANWIINEVLRERKGDEPLRIVGRHIGELVALIEADTISGKMAKEVFAQMLPTGESPGSIVERLGLAQQSDSAAIGVWVAEVLAAHADVVEKYRQGKTNGLGFLVGKVLQKSGGSANPKVVNQALLAALQPK